MNACKIYFSSPTCFSDEWTSWLVCASRRSPRLCWVVCRCVLWWYKCDDVKVWLCSVLTVVCCVVLCGMKVWLWWQWKTYRRHPRYSSICDRQHNIPLKTGHIETNEMSGLLTITVFQQCSSGITSMSADHWPKKNCIDDNECICHRTTIGEKTC